jgi:hypothetical protein
LASIDIQVDWDEEWRVREDETGREALLIVQIEEDGDDGTE